MKKGLAAALAALCLISVLCACEGEREPTELQLYFPCAEGENGKMSDAVDTQNYFGEATAAALIDAMLAGPTEIGLDGLFDSEVPLLSWSLMGGVLRMDFASEYAELAAVDQTLAECCIVLTLSQLDGVEKVCITAGGREVPGSAYLVLTADHMILTGAEEEPRQMSVELYFPRSGGRGLGFEIRELTLTESDDLYMEVTLALLAGPESGTLRALFPEGTQVLDARVDDGICYVNFTAELLENAPEDPAEQDMLLYSIVDTLGNLDLVNAVQVLVEGAVPKNYGNTDTSFPLEPDFGLLARD